MACRRLERGAVLIWAVLALVAVGSLMALAINIGRLYSVRGGLQNGVDAAALGGAGGLNGQMSGIDDGRVAAAALAGRHGTDSSLAVTIDPAADVVFGQWDLHARTFTRIDTRTGADLRNINAVRVQAGREGARGNSVPVIFGGGAFLQRDTVDVRAQAIAVGGGPCEDKCSFPAAFADCMMVDSTGALRCDQGFYVLNNDWQDNMGLTSLEPGVPASVPNIKAALGACLASGADDAIPVTNGNPLNPISKDPYFNRLPIEVTSPVVHADRCPPATYQKCQSSGPNSPCVNAKFVGDMTVVGYATFVICYVTGANPVKLDGTGGLPGWPASCGPSPRLTDFPGLPAGQWPDPFLKNSIFIQHKCYTAQPGPTSGVAGCGFFGTSSTRSRLVQ
jgi:hypothetical protein